MTVQRSASSSRAKPSGGGFELTVWYLMRFSGLGLFVLVLSHYLILHVLYDPAQQDASWIATLRWSSLFWRVYDWSMLMLVLFHGFMGMRVVVSDYADGRRRRIALGALSALAVALFLMGTYVVITLANVVPKA